MSKHRLLIVSLSNVASDPRPYRQAAMLRDTFEVTVAALGDPGISGARWIPIRKRARNSLRDIFWAANLLIGNDAPYLSRYPLAALMDAPEDFDVIIAHCPEALRLVAKRYTHCPIVFDAHEYYPREFEHSWTWRLFFQRCMMRLCRQYLPHCAKLVTVSQGLVDEYRRVFGCEGTVVYSGPEFQSLEPSPVDNDAIRLIYHGGASPDRDIEAMIATMDLLDDRFTLDFMITGSGPYIDKLRALSAHNPRIRWRDPVPMPRITEEINRYDIGLLSCPPNTFNIKYSLPNKFFEFIQARLAIAIGPLPDMELVVNKYELGVVAADFSPATFAAKFKSLSSEAIKRFKFNSDKAARIFNAEASMNTLRNVLSDAMKGRKL